MDMPMEHSETCSTAGATRGPPRLCQTESQQTTSVKPRNFAEKVLSAGRWCGLTLRPVAPVNSCQRQPFQIGLLRFHAVMARTVLNPHQRASSGSSVDSPTEPPVTGHQSRPLNGGGPPAVFGHGARIWAQDQGFHSDIPGGQQHKALPHKSTNFLRTLLCVRLGLVSSE